VQPGARIADLRAGDERRAVVEAGRRRCAAGALRDVFVDLAVLVRTGPKPLTDATIIRGLSSWMCAQVSPMRSSAPGAKFSNQDVATPDQRLEDFLPFECLASTVIDRLLWFNIVK